jgi:hypothetical protein
MTKRNSIMTTHTHQTVPTQFVEAKGIRFTYRRFGKARGVAGAAIARFRSVRN